MRESRGLWLEEVMSSGSSKLNWRAAWGIQMGMPKTE